MNFGEGRFIGSSFGYKGANLLSRNRTTHKMAMWVTIVPLVWASARRAISIHHITSIRRVVVVGVDMRVVVIGFLWMGLAPDSARARSPLWGLVL